MAETAQEHAALDPIAFRNACGTFATGVTVITTKADGVEHGMTANAFMSISLDPALIAISIGKQAKMLEFVNEAQRFAVSILADGTQSTAMHFAGRPDDALKMPFETRDDLPVVRDAVCFFTADVWTSVEAGDHVVFIGHVRTMDTAPEVEPLIFHKGRFGKLEPFQDAAVLDASFDFESIHW